MFIIVDKRNDALNIMLFLFYVMNTDPIPTNFRDPDPDPWAIDNGDSNGSGSDTLPQGYKVNIFREATKKWSGH